MARRLGQKCGKEPERRKLCRACGLVGSVRCTIRKAKGKSKKGCASAQPYRWRGFKVLNGCFSNRKKQARCLRFSIKGKLQFSFQAQLAKIKKLVQLGTGFLNSLYSHIDCAQPICKWSSIFLACCAR
ncbi:hypothetical protein P4K11_32175, partial [Bacillus cereus]